MNVSIQPSEKTMEKINYNNEFGSLSLGIASEYLPVGRINYQMEEVATNLFSLETAEKIALITGNKGIQICFCYPFNGKAYLIHHKDSHHAAVCQIGAIEYKSSRSPAEQIEYLHRGMLSL